ncbi:hypothetical protein D9615_010071 [Tricholomella constricta]|uniref:Uncharacterized protein n=1 Tax=Tricholomella constricta TaxID=117010 RepID=A0A8H5LUT7_9AGAR|nr:hypothetical protein D9615_010071 [Tricholomella constricta]
MDFVQSLDPSKLVLAETVLSFAVSPFAAPPYNLAIFLFGTYVQENTEAVHSLQTFTGLLGASTILDVVWMLNNDQNGFVKLLTVVILLLKIPTFLAFGISLRQRGTSFGGLGGADLSGPTVWSMPGGFTSSGREGYQTVDEERPSHTSRPPVPAPPLSNTHSAAPGAYQTA